MTPDTIFLNAGHAAASDRGGAAALPSNPFVGLRPFESEESVLFFGRDRQIVELLEQLHRTRFLAVVGSSGCGKSSLIRAGLIPKLKAGFIVERRDRWSVVTMKPGDSPLTNLATALLQAAGAPADRGAGGGEDDATSAFLKAVRVSGAKAVLERLAAPLDRDGANLLLLVDQFEELFRYGGQAQRGADADGEDGDAPADGERARAEAVERLRRRDEATRFVAVMLDLARQHDVPVYVAMTMRSDFLGDCDAFRGLPEQINHSLYLVPRLDRQQRQEAVENPVRLYGRSITPRLLDRVVNDVGDEPDQLPVMQHALMRTWEEWRRDAGGDGLDLRHYEAAGTFHGALSQDADRALGEMTPEDQLIAERMFQALVDTDAQGRRTRRPVHLGELAKVAGTTPEKVLEVADHFRGEGRCFLMLSSERAADDPLVDISHESFIRQWGALRRWVKAENESKEQYTRIAEAALRHRAGRSGLWTDPELQSALKWWEERAPTKAWARRYSRAFWLSNAFLKRSARRDAEEKARLERQRLQEVESEKVKRQNVSLRRFSYGLLLLAFVAVLGFLFAGLSMTRARASQRAAVESEAKARANEALAENLNVELKKTFDQVQQQKEIAEKAVIDLQKQKEISDRNAEKALAEKKRADQQARIATAEAAAAKKAREDLKRANESKVKEMEAARKELLGQLGGLYYSGISLLTDPEVRDEVNAISTFEEILKIYEKDDVREGKLSTLLLLGQSFTNRKDILDNAEGKKALGYYGAALPLFEESKIYERTQKIKTLVKMGDILYFLYSPDKAGAAKRYEEAVELGETPMTQSLLSGVYEKLGNIYAGPGPREERLKAAGFYQKELASNDDELKSVQEMFNNASEGSKKESGEELEKLKRYKYALLVKLVTLYARVGQKEEERKTFDSLAEYASAERETFGGPQSTLVWIALNFDRPGEEDMRDTYLRRALEGARASGKPEEEAAADLYIGGQLYKVRAYQAALPYLADAVKLYRETLKNPLGEAGALRTIAICHVQMGNKQEAINYYKRARAIYEELGMNLDVLRIANTLQELGDKQ